MLCTPVGSAPPTRASYRGAEQSGKKHSPRWARWNGTLGAMAAGLLNGGLDGDYAALADGADSLDRADHLVDRARVDRGVRPEPTPSGVPVKMRSPGRDCCSPSRTAAPAG
ncbi:hypothetical protein Afe04nite_60650 [Asanoa ferruginea]|nr:hypothetical protein Afe04nite_60650 [Asanoa ferruginea]